jgi:hypothetical protein
MYAQLAYPPLRPHSQHHQRRAKAAQPACQNYGLTILVSSSATTLWDANLRVDLMLWNLPRCLFF